MFRTKFAALRLQKGISEQRIIPLAEIADQAKVSRSTLNRWNSNEALKYIDSRSIGAVAGYFHVKPSEFIIIDDEAYSGGSRK